jgi:glycosyltransferase involved in cell wall biosynthesis
MRILQIINSLQIGGAQRLLADFLPLMNRQHDVELLTLKDDPSPFAQQLHEVGIKMHCLNIKSLYNPLVALKIRRFLKRQPRYDIIHVHLFPALYWVPLATAGMRQHLIWTEHSTSNRRQQKLFFRYADRMAYSQYDKIICISQATCNSLGEWMGAQANDSRLCVIENGIDTAKFIRKKTERQQPYTLIQVSRFEASKDQDTVIRAMPLLPQDIQLVFVGDGSRMEACKELCKKLNVQDRVRFLGARADIAQLLSEADIAIQSSHWEGFGLTAVEAMAAGLPVIATNVDGLRQVVEDAGMLFTQGDEKELAQTISLLINTPTLYHDLSEKSLQQAKYYDISNMTDKYMEIYEAFWNSSKNKKKAITNEYTAYITQPH